MIAFHMPSATRRALPYLRTAEVADILGISKKTLKNWLRRDVIPEPERNPSNRYRLWTLEDVQSVRRLILERNGVK